MVEVPLFKKLILVVPISVLRAGTYQVTASYSDNEFGGTAMKDVAQAFNVGSHTVRIEFLGHESGSWWGYPSPKAAGGRARILLSYRISRKALLDILQSDSAIDQKMLQRFMKDEGLDKGVNPNATVNKFVGRKEVQF